MDALTSVTMQRSVQCTARTVSQGCTAVSFIGWTTPHLHHIYHSVRLIPFCVRQDPDSVSLPSRAQYQICSPSTELSGVPFRRGPKSEHAYGENLESLGESGLQLLRLQMLRLGHGGQVGSHELADSL